jgi:Ca-activated chloride channel family protein
VRGAAQARISTSCIGFGAHFQEELLGAMATAGSGNYWYVESADQMGDIFGQEIEGLVALGAQNVTVEVRDTHPSVHGVSFPQSFMITRSPDGGWIAMLGDLYATSPRSLGVILHVEDVGTLGEQRIANIVVTADVLRANGIEHRRVTMPVVANISGRDAIEPAVESKLLHYAAARAREDAVRAADAGDHARAAQILEDAGKSLDRLTDAESVHEAGDLRAQAEQMRQREYRPEDRKYHLARSRAMAEDKVAYLARTRRGR